MGATSQLLLCLCLILAPSSAFLAYPLQRSNHPSFCCTLAQLQDGHRPSSCSHALRRHFMSQSDEDEYIPSKRGPPQGGDMAYIAKNIQRQMNTYQAIRQASMTTSIHDVYVRQNTTFWYIGKLAVAGVTVEQGVQRQRNLIEEHATRLRPVELGRMFNRLEYWIAPGDSELECSLGNIDLRRVHLEESSTNVSLKSVGFFCEVVTNRGVGFSIQREVDGTVPKPFQ